MTHRRRWILPSIVIVIVAALTAALLPSPVPVTVVEAILGPFEEIIAEEGRTRLRDSYMVSAPISGYLLRVAVEPGDRVERGGILFRMEPLPAPALDARTLEQARESLSAAQAIADNAVANLEAVEVDARFAQSEFDRYSELYGKGLSSVAEMQRSRAARDRLLAARRAAQSAVEVASFEKEKARAVLEIASGARSLSDQPRLEVRSPIDGVVLRRDRCCEGTVFAGEQILEVGNLNNLEVVVDLLSTSAVKVRSGMMVRLTGWGGNEPLEGVVRRVEPAGFTRVSALGVDEQRVPVVVDFSDPRIAASQMGVAFRVEAEFIVWAHDNVLQVPTSTLFRSPEGWMVYAVESGKARLRGVELGRSSGFVTQILKGVQSGELLIAYPSGDLKDGTSVKAD